MITQIFGKPGVGKTALMVKFALEYMTGPAARQDVRKCGALVNRLNAGGFNFIAPTDHLVYSDTAIFTRNGRVRSHECDGFDLGLYDPDHFTKFFPPYSRFFLDEAQKYFNSREKGVADSVSRFYELHRHNGFEFFLVSQRPGLIDKNIRELSERVIEIVSLEHNEDRGRILSSAWYCRVYADSAAALLAVDGKEAPFTETVFTFDGDIFRHYDSYYFRAAHYHGAYGHDFEQRHSSYTPLDVDGVREFNDAHSYLTPTGYFKKRSFNEIVSEYMLRLYHESNLPGLFTESDRVFRCCKEWICDHYKKSNVADVQYVSHCRSRFCLMCEKLKQAGYFNKYLPFLKDAAKTYDLYHVVFTVPNVRGFQLRGMIECMSAAFRRLLNFLSGRKPIRGIDFKQYDFYAGIRTLEVTYGKYGEDDFHPHYHCIMAFKKGLVLDKYLKNAFSYDEGVLVRKFSDLEVLLQKLWRLLIDSEFEKYYNASVFRRRLGVPLPVRKRPAIQFPKPARKRSERITLERLNALDRGYSVIMDFIEDAGDESNYFEIFKYICKVTSEQNSLFTYEQFVTLYFSLSGIRTLQGFGKWCDLKFDDEFDEIVNEFYPVFIAYLRQREFPVPVRFQLSEVADKIQKEHVLFITKKSMKRYLSNCDKPVERLKSELGNPAPYTSPSQLHFPDMVSALFRYERVKRTSPLFADIRLKEQQTKEENKPLVLTSEQLSFLDTIF